MLPNRHRALHAGPLALVLCALAGCERARSEQAGSEQQAAEQRFGDLPRIAYDLTDKGPRVHDFTEIYEHILFPLRNEPIRILEVGVADGGSLQMWQQYFPKATICGLDIRKKKKFENERVKTAVADQANREQMAHAFEQCGGGQYDFMLDDGGHEMHQQQICFAFCFEHVKPGGYYILEDVHTSLPDLWPDHGAEPDGSNTTLRMIEEFFRTGHIESEYMTSEEMAYLSEQIEYCNLFFRNNEHHSMTAIFKKKAE